MRPTTQTPPLFPTMSRRPAVGWRVTLAALTVAGGLGVAAAPSGGCARASRPPQPAASPAAAPLADHPTPATAPSADKPVAATSPTAAVPATEESAVTTPAAASPPANPAVVQAPASTPSAAEVQSAPAVPASPALPAALGSPAATAPSAAAAPESARPAVGAPTAFPGIADAEVKDAGLGLAQRLAAAAFEVLQTGDNDREDAAWLQAAAYLEAAGRLDPTEPYYPRLRAMALEKAHDPEGAADALVAYLRLNTADEVAKLRLIEYYASRSQSNAAKIEYLKGLLEKPTVSDEIKSRCATWLAEALLERSIPEAATMVERAVKLDPVNVYARKLEYRFVQAVGTPVDRVRSLFAQLRCNPSQVPVLWAIGKELGQAGLYRDSAKWYTSAASLSDRAGTPVSSTFFVELAAQLFINGELDSADRVTQRVVETDKTNMDGWFLRLTLRRAANQRVAYEQDLEQVKRLLVGRAGVLAGMILEQPGDAPAAAAATQPGGPASRPFDFGGAFAAGGGGEPGAAAGAGAPSADTLTRVVARLAQPGASPYFRSEFISAVVDLAWYELYFNRSETAAATWVNVARQLLGEQDLTARRLGGWLDLLRGQDAKAMQTLWAGRKADALSGMGVVELLSRGKWGSTATRPGVAPPPVPPEYNPDLLAQDLLDAYPSGPIGAMLNGAFKGRKLYARPGRWADGMRDELKAFPIDLIAVVDQPDRFYVPVGEETKKPYRLGEPVMVKVRLQNNSLHDLPVGPDGIIKPDLWFDGRVTLARDRQFPMCGTDKVANALVLKAKSSVTQYVRVDQGPLAAALRERPAGSVSLYLTVMTNALVQQDASSPTGVRVVAGPGGVRRQFKDALIRGGLPINSQQDQKKLLDLTAGLPTQKLWALDTMAAFVEQARGPDAEPRSQALQPEFVEQINRAQADRVPLVGAWATIAALRLMDDPAQAANKPRLVEPLLTSRAWEVRLAAVLAARELDPADAKAVAAKLKDDPDPVVRTAAMAEDVLAPRRQAAKPGKGPAGPATFPTGPTGPSAPGGSSTPGGPALPPAGPALPPPAGQ